MTVAARSHDRAMAENGIGHLRVLIANERRNRLELLAQVVAGLGHEVIAREIDVKEVGPVTAKEQPDLAYVGPRPNAASPATPSRSAPCKDRSR
jgi:hypothetical protein